MSEIKTRFAPSPTGALHVGSLRTALFNFLFARHNKGRFILRIEDTDQSREVAGSASEIQKILQEFTLTWDEGPFYQSRRLKIYQDHIAMLLESGAAYRCYCTPERLLELRSEADAAKIPFKYDKRCFIDKNQTGDKFVIRQNIPEEGIVEFQDLVHGKIQIQNRELDDGILVKSDGWPVYNFANVIDDHLMSITHVIRGEEFIPSTPKHILLYHSFGWDVPQFAHLPLLLDKNRKKLSKRQDDVAVNEYVEKGYLKDAILNFVALLGWNPKTTKEIFSLQDLIAEFDFEKVNRAGAVFDIEKLNFLNRKWQKKLPSAEADPLYGKTFRLLSAKFGAIDENFFTRIWPMVTERIKGPSELEEKLPEFYFFFAEPEYEAQLLIWKDTPKEKILGNLVNLTQFLEKQTLLAGSSKNITAYLKEQGIGTGESLWPLRVALTGLKASPGPFEILDAFAAQSRGQKIILERLQKALAKLEKI